jgi:hypothetical protein
MNFLFLQHTLTNNFTRGNNNQITENQEAQVSVNTHRHIHTLQQGKWDPLQYQHFTASYNDPWNGWGGPMAWPPRSPYLTPMHFFLWGHIKAPIYTSPVDSEEDLIVHIVEAAGTWHFWAHISLCCVVGCILRLVAIWLDNCSELVWNTFFFPFRILKWFCLISNLSQIQFDSPWCYKDESPTYSSLTTSLCFGPLITWRSLGMEFFCTVYNCLQLHSGQS